MKRLIKNLLFVMVIGSLSMQSCKNDDPDGPSTLEEAYEKLSGDWSIENGGSVLLDGQNVSLNYVGISLSFADGTYQTVNAGELFDASGTWEWADDIARQITLGDGKTVTILELTETSFRFSFTFSGTGGVANGVDGTNGNYEITVVK
ncbi:MAG: hypothetical protein Roseis2KO_31960 [Roseivirga sp.]